MTSATHTMPLPLHQVDIRDAFWLRVMELVRREVIPYQWDALNDRVSGAAPSYCMHNFRAAARLTARRRAEGSQLKGKYGLGAFEQLPDDPKNPDPDRFYGFVFQDTDFSKWIEAVGYSLAVHPDPELEKIADDAIDVVCAAQAEDGYLDTCYILGGMEKRFTNLRDHHELYCLGHLIEGAIAYFQATGKDKLLRAACRFADHVDSRFGPEEGKCHGYPGHEIAEMALLRLYEVTGEERYRRLGCYFIDQRGQQPLYFVEEYERRLAAEGKAAASWTTDPAYHQAQSPVREQREATGHAVRAMYLYSGMADAARICGDASLRAACERLWESTVRTKMYVTGGVGGTVHGEAFSFPFDLPSDSAYSETCAAIGLVFFARRMLQLEARSDYADVMELALYNTVLAGMALDGKSFFYVNPLEVVPEAVRADKRLQHVKPVRQKWFGCACCPPNIARLIGSLGAYVCTSNAQSLALHLYVSGDIRTQLSGHEVCLHVESGLPWDGQVRITVDAPVPAEGTLRLRIPGWARDVRLACPPGKTCAIENGYHVLSGVWHSGDSVTLSMDMPVRVLQSDDRVRETAAQVAFMRGPIVYCGEEADNGQALHLLRVSPQEALSQAVAVACTAFSHPVMMLEVPAARVHQPPQNGLYSDWQPDTVSPVTLRLVPYYCWANRGEGEMRVWWHTR